MKRRLFIKTIVFFTNILPLSSFSKNIALSLRECPSIDMLHNMIPKYAGEEVKLLSFEKGGGLGGGVFSAIKKKMKTDYGIYIDTPSEYTWVRKDAYKNITKPEWFGCVGNGVSDDSIAFNNMLNSLKDNDVIILRENANYFNKLPDKKSRFIIKKDNITIIGNGATISRRPTSIETKDIDVGNLATLKITGNNAKIIGKLVISGGENRDFLVNRINSKVSDKEYIRGYSSSHALFVEKVDGLYLSPDLICEDAIFPLYILSSRNLNIQGTYKGSGQVYPVKGRDLQLGSCIKIAKSAKFNVNVTTNDSAYCGCEIEPYCDYGIVNVEAQNCYMHGCIVHQKSNNVKVRVDFSDSEKGAGLRISNGCENVFGTVSAKNCENTVLIVSKGELICKNINIKINSYNNRRDALVIYNVNKSNAAIIGSKFTLHTDIESVNKSMIDITRAVDTYIYLDEKSFDIYKSNLKEIKDSVNTVVSLISS